LVQAAIDLGVTVFDTADVYGSGASEHVLGRALRTRRNEVVIATKGGFVFRDRPPIEQWARRRAKRWRQGGDRGRAAAASISASYARQDFSAQHIRQAVHASLRRLRTDRIDVYQLHDPQQVSPDLFDQLADLVTTGEVARFGVGAGSSGSADGWIDVRGVSVVQVPFGVLDPQAGTATIPLAHSHGLEVWARGVLGGGLFGLADRDPAAIAGHPKRRQVEAIRRIASEAGVDQCELAFGFIRATAPDVSTVLVGTTSREHLSKNLAAAAAPALSQDVLDALAELTTAPMENG